MIDFLEFRSVRLLPKVEVVYWTVEQILNNQIRTDWFNEFDWKEFTDPFTGFRDSIGQKVFNGDIVRVLTERLSGSSDHWYQKTNENHGDVTLDMEVYYDDKNYGYGLRLLDREEVRRKEAPVGKERTSQHIHVPYNLSDRLCVQRGRVIGNRYEGVREGYLNAKA